MWNCRKWVLASLLAMTTVIAAAGSRTAYAQEAETEAAQSDSLVVFFSRTGEQYGVGVIDKGNTAIVAEMAAEAAGADLWEILPQEDNYPYTYDELCDVAKQEQRDNARPAYRLQKADAAEDAAPAEDAAAGETAEAGDTAESGSEEALPDLSAYDTIYIGAPVWWGDWPMIMYTFFEENEEALVGKTLIPFCTHAGSGLSGFDKKLAEACPMSTVGTGLAISGEDAQNAQDSVKEKVAEWTAAQ